MNCAARVTSAKCPSLSCWTSPGFTAEVLRNAGFPEEIISYAHAIIFDKRIISDQAFAHLQAAIKSARPITADDVPSAHSAHEVVADIMHEFPDRDRSILERRYGFLTGRIETLEEIALDYQRDERAHSPDRGQKSPRRIGRSKLGETIAAGLRSGDRGAINGGDRKPRLHRVRREISGSPQAFRRRPFAIDVLYEDRDKFLRKVARRWHGGWILPPLVKEELQELSGK